MRPPRLPKGWQWNLDRTADIVDVRIRIASRTSPGTFYEPDVSAITPASAFGLWFSMQLVRALSIIWDVRTDVELWFDNRLNEYRLQREAAHLALAAAIHGRYDHRGERISSTTVPPCPECAAGKHSNCDGRSWDNEADEHTECPCSSAGHNEEENHD